MRLIFISNGAGVAWLLVEAGVRDVDVLQAALLHDTVEDTDTTPQELEEAFGKKVADIVAEVKYRTKIMENYIMISRLGHFLYFHN